MTQKFALRGLRPNNARLRFRQRTAGVDQSWTETLALSPGIYNKDFAALSAYVGQHLPLGLGGTAERVPDLSSITVSVNRSEGPRPLGVAFYLKSTDPNFPSFVKFGTAKWTFSHDEGENYVFRSLSSKLAGETAGTAFGPYVGHTYLTGPGVGVAGTVAHQWSVVLSYPGLPDRTISWETGATDDLTGQPCGAILVHDDERWFDGDGTHGSHRGSLYWSPAFATVQEFYDDLAAKETATPGSSGFYGWGSLDEAQRKSYLRVGNLNTMGTEVGGASIESPPAIPFAYRRRLLIQAGTTAVSTNAYEHRAGPRNFRIDRFGPGNDPVLDFSGVTALLDGSHNWNVMGCRTGAELMHLKFVGPYNPVAPGKAAAPQYALDCIFNAVNMNEGLYWNFFRLEISGFHMGINRSAHPVDLGVISDCFVHDWYNYGVWTSGFNRSAIVGTRIAQNPNALMLQRRHRSRNGGNLNMTHLPSSTFTSGFNWSEQGPVTNSSSDLAFPTAIPAGYEIPSSGGWGTHPYDTAHGGTAAWDWWAKNYWRFSGWTGANWTAFDNGFNEQYEKCAIHGPLRESRPTSRFGLHQCELETHNGWSTYFADTSLVDEVTGHWDRAQPASSWWIQETVRWWTAPGPNSADIDVSQFGLSVWRVENSGGNGMTLKPQTDDQLPWMTDARTMHSGMIFDGMISEEVDFPLGYAHCAVRNCVTFRAGTERSNDFGHYGPTTESRIGQTTSGGVVYSWLVDGMKAQEPIVVYNNTMIYTGSVAADTVWRFIGQNDLQAGDSQQREGRRLYEWNNARIVDATGPAPADGTSTYTNLTATTALVGTLATGYAPQAGSSLLEAAQLGLQPRYDVEGQTRQVSTAAGAFDVT